jgi:hypothetical protein
MAHNVQATFNEVKDMNDAVTRVMAAGGFVRVESDTVLTVSCSSEDEAKVRAIVLNPIVVEPDAPA